MRGARFNGPVYGLSFGFERLRVHGPPQNWKFLALTMLCSSIWGLELPQYSSPEEVRMPHYEFFCHNCEKHFSKILTLVDYEEGQILCPHCGSKEVEQRWSVFSAITSKKSA